MSSSSSKYVSEFLHGFAATILLMKYTPPSDFELRSGTIASGFESELFQDKELWLLRIPDNVDPKKLDGLQIKHPKIAHTKEGGKDNSSGGVLGQATVNDLTYDLITSESSLQASEFNGMAEMNILVPDTDNDGLLTLLPNGCSQLLSLVERFDIPDAVDYANEIVAREHFPPRPQPDNMKMKFIPYGFFSAEEYNAMKDKKATEDILLSDPQSSTNGGGDNSLPAPALKKRKTDKSKPVPTAVDQELAMDVDKPKDEKTDKKKEKSKSNGKTATVEKKSKKEKKNKKASDN
ncbi:hypothetical protein H4217_001869 [Coemansia sp. RSA 1939]|nr:hypothetical protein H4217_001869 [Coemansia sp. RSA 1939]KAJ2617159.1 hypothetical protein EV177_000691 [Coemansia sp. RSA 1804]